MCFVIFPNVTESCLLYALGVLRKASVSFLHPFPLSCRQCFLFHDVQVIFFFLSLLKNTHNLPDKVYPSSVFVTSQLWAKNTLILSSPILAWYTVISWIIKLYGTMHDTKLLVSPLCPSYETVNQYLHAFITVTGTLFIFFPSFYDLNEEEKHKGSGPSRN